MKLEIFLPIFLLLFSMSCQDSEDQIIYDNPTSENLIVTIVNCPEPNCDEFNYLQNELVTIHSNYEDAVNNINSIKQNRTDNNGKLSLFLPDIHEIFIRWEYNLNVYIGQEKIAPNSVSWHQIGNIKDCVFQNNDQHLCKFYDQIFGSKLNKYAFFTADTLNPLYGLNYIGDTLIVEIINSNFENSILVKEYFQNPSETLEKIIPFANTVYTNKFTLSSSGQIYMESENNSLTNSHLLVNSNESIGYLVLNELNFNLRQNKTNEYLKNGWVHNPVNHLNQHGFITNETYLNTEYDSLNVLRTFGNTSADVPDKIYIYNGVYGFVHTSMTIPHGFPKLYGFTLIEK